MMEKVISCIVMNILLTNNNIEYNEKDYISIDGILFQYLYVIWNK